MSEHTPVEATECGCVKKLHSDDGLWWCKHGPTTGFAQINLSDRPGAPGSRSLVDLRRGKDSDE